MNRIGIRCIPAAVFILVSLIAPFTHAATWGTVTPLPGARNAPAAEAIAGVVYLAGGNDGASQTSMLQAFNTASGTWSTLASMPGGRYSGNGAGVIGGKLYVAGGWDNTITALPHAELFVYDPASNSWSTKAPLPTLSASGATGVINGKLYVTTAANGNSGYRNWIHVYDPSSNAWTQLTSSAVAHAGPAFGVLNGKLYTAGGYDDAGNIQARLEAFDPATNSWTTKAPLPAAGANFQSVVVNGIWYVFGGNNGAVYNTTVYAYNPGTDAWSTAGSLPLNRVAGAAAAVNDVVYLAGGSNASGLVTQVDTFKVPAAAPTATWGTVADLPQPRSMSAAESINGVVYLAGGFNVHETPTLQAFNTASGTWSTLASMPSGRYQGDGAGVIGGKLYLAGGWDNSFSSLPHSDLFVYDPSANTWSSLASMPTLSGSGATGVINGKLYVTTAANGNSGYRNWLHVYDPSSNAWTQLASSAVAHAGPGSGVINGKLYLAGGGDDAGTIQASVEVYDPAANSWSTKAPLPAAGGQFESAVVNGIWYLFGGSNAAGALNSTVYAYDPVADAWSTAATMSAVRNFGAAAAVNNVVYLLGGSNATTIVTAVDTFSLSPSGFSLAPSAGAAFAATNSGAQSAPATFTLSNGSAASVTVASISITGTDAGQFSVASGGASPCVSLTPTLAAGASCTVTASFAPTSAGAKSAALTVVSNAAGATSLSAALSGTGVLPVYALSVTRSGAGSGSVTPSTGTLTWIGNSGTVSYNQGTQLTLTAVADAGSAFDGWSGCDSVSGVGNSVCTVTMSAAKSVAATFSNAPSFALTAGAIAVVQGDTRQATVTLTASNGFNSPVAISWGTLPAGAIAGVATSPLTPTALGASAAFSFSAGSATPLGAATVRLSATGGGITKTFDLPVAVAAPLSLGSAPFPDGQKGVAYSAALTTGGGIGAVTFARSAGALPDGLTLSAGGVLAGTPTARGTFSFTIQAQDGDGHSAASPYSVKISDPNYRKLVIVAADPSYSWQVQKGAQSPSLYVKVVDGNGNDAPVGADTKVNLNSSSTSGRFSDGTLSSLGNTFTLTINAGFNLAEVFYIDSTTGVATLTASGKAGFSSASWDSGTQQITVTAPNLPPAALSASVASASFGQSVTVTGTLKDGSTGVALPFTGVCIVLNSPVQTQTPEKCVQTGSDGSYSQIADVSYVDRAGSWSASASFKGNASYNAASASAPFVMAKADTSILITLDATSISPIGSVTATGKVSSPTVANLASVSVAVDFIAPDGTVHTVSAAITDTLGHYSARYSQFSEGLWKVKARVVTDTNFNGIESDLKNVVVANAAGYAILIEGELNSGQYRANYTVSLDDIRNKLLSRSFTDDTIRYLSYETGHTGVDLPTTKANIQNAITQWAWSKIQQYGVAPVYIVMMDHGGQGGKFYIQQPGDPASAPQYITPEDLNGWIASLETQVATLGKTLTTMVVDGSCYSGSFIPALSGPNRVIVASSTAAELSAQGPSFNQKTFGEYFVYYLFNSLSSGETVNNAFAYAAGLTQQLRQCSTAACLQNGIGMGDSAAQHPLLDDNGDQIGSPALTIGQKDGALASKMVLGLGSNALGLQWQGAMPTTAVALGSASVPASVTAWASIDLASTGSSWVEIRRPDYVPPDAGGTGQVVVSLPSVTGTPNQAAGRYDYLIQPNASIGFAGLDIPGTYTLYYYATDLNGEIIPPQVGTLCVADAGNHAPSALTPISPASGDVIDSSLMLLSWNETTDPDNDPVTYTVKIYDDLNGVQGSEAKRYELIPQGSYVLDSSQEKRADGSSLFASGGYYWWEILAVDSKGASTSGGARRFRTTFTNGLLGIVLGYVRSDSGKPIARATVKVGTATVTTLSNGAFFTLLPSGSYSVSVTAAAGYQLKSAFPVTVVAGGVVNAGTTLTPIPLAGDCDGSGVVTLAEVQAGINMFLGSKPPLACVDTNGDGVVSIGEVQKVINNFIGL